MKIEEISLYSLLGKLEQSSKLFLKVRERIMDYGMRNLGKKKKKKKKGEKEKQKLKKKKPKIWTKVIDFHLFVLTLKLGFDWEWSKQANHLLCFVKTQLYYYQP